MRKLGALVTVVVGTFGALTACSDKPYDPDAPAYDPTAPTVVIDSPARGTILGDVDHVVVQGHATDDTGVVGVTVNDIPADLKADGSFTVTLPINPGTRLLHAKAVDAQGNEGKETRAVVAGPMAPLNKHVPQSITATMSAQTFDAIGRGASNFVNTADLTSMVSPYNPVYSAGAESGPDCLYGMASITSVSVGNTNISLYPVAGGMYVDAELDNVFVGMHLDYAAACIDGGRDITVAMDHVSAAGNLSVAMYDDGTFDVHLDNPDVQITNLDLELGGIPGAIVDLLSLDTAMGPILGWAIERFMAPAINNSLAGLGVQHTVNVLGTNVDVSVAPHSIDFEDVGALVDLDSSLRAQGDDGGPGFVYVPNTAPAMDMSQGFQVAVADDVANQLLASLWSAKALDRTLDLKTGPYGNIGTLYDSVELEAMVPPYIDANAGQVTLTVGDLMATFKLNGEAVTKIAISAEVGVKVKTDPNGALRLDVGDPTVFVDVDSNGVMGANELSNADFEQITSFALGRVIAVGSGSVGAVPLPSVGGVSLADVSVNEKFGYIVVNGEVH